MSVDSSGNLTGGPIDLSQFNTEQLDALAGKVDIPSPLNKDQVVSQLEYLQDQGISLDQTHLDNLISGHPVLNTPEANRLLSINPSDIKDTMGSNPFLAANPLATLVQAMLDFVAEQTEAKLKEAVAAARAILTATATTRELAQLTKDLGKQEALAHIAGAIAAGIKAATGAVSTYAYAKAPKGMSDGALMARSGTIKGTGDAVTGMADMVKGVIDAKVAVTKADLEYTKKILEHIQEIARQEQQNAKEAYRTSDELITQVLQNLTKLIDEQIKAHNSIGNR